MNDPHRGALTTNDPQEAARTLSRLIGRAQVEAPQDGTFESPQVLCRSGLSL